MSEPGLDALIHPIARLKLCGLLAPLEEAEFAFLRVELGVSDSVLSKHLGQLEDAGYVRLRKGKVQGRRRTWASMTARGHAAFAAHVAGLQALAGQVAEENPDGVRSPGSEGALPESAS